MSRIETFTFRVNADERRTLAALAEYLHRSQSDAVRLLIRTAARELADDANETAKRNSDAAFEKDRSMQGGTRRAAHDGK